MDSLSGGFKDVLCWTQHGEKISVWRICFKLSWNHLSSSPWLCLKSRKRVPLENSRWFKVTFWFPINQVKGHLSTPKRSPAELPGMKFYYPSCLWASGSDRSLGRTFGSFRASIFFQNFYSWLFWIWAPKLRHNNLRPWLDKKPWPSILRFRFLCMAHLTWGAAWHVWKFMAVPLSVSKFPRDFNQSSRAETHGTGKHNRRKKTHSETQNWLDQPIELVKAVTSWDR